jgi:hypothetical protein
MFIVGFLVIQEGIIYSGKRDAGVAYSFGSLLHISIWPLPANSHFDFGFGLFEVRFKLLR